MLKRHFNKNRVVAFIELSPTKLQQQSILNSFNKFQKNLYKRQLDLSNGFFKGIKIDVSDIPSNKLNTLPHDIRYSQLINLESHDPINTKIKKHELHSDSINKRDGIPLDFQIRKGAFIPYHQDCMHVTALQQVAYEDKKPIDQFYELIHERISKIQDDLTNLKDSNSFNINLKDEFKFFTSIDFYKVFLSYIALDKPKNPVLNIVSKHMNQIINDINITPINQESPSRFLSEQPHSTIAYALRGNLLSPFDYSDLKFYNEIFFTSKDKLLEKYSSDRDVLYLDKISELEPVHQPEPGNSDSKSKSILSIESPRLVVVINDSRLVFPLTTTRE